MQIKFCLFKYFPAQSELSMYFSRLIFNIKDFDNCCVALTFGCTEHRPINR